MKKRKKPRMTLFYLIILVILLILVLSGTKAFLYLNFLLGNDVVIKLKSESDLLSLQNGESSAVNFETSITTNPFCSAVCSFEFTDLTTESLIDKSNSTIRPLLPERMSYEISADWFGEGQRYYRFSVECHSLETLLCHTTEEPTSRSILVVVNHELNESEKRIKEYALSFLQDSILSLNNLMKDNIRTKVLLDRLDPVVIVDDYARTQIRLSSEIEDVKSALAGLQDLWNEENYVMLDKEFRNFNSTLNTIFSELSDVKEKSQRAFTTYNILTGKLNETADVLEGLESLALLNRSILLKINSVITEYNKVVDIFSARNVIETKEKSVTNVLSDSKILESSYKQILVDRMQQKQDKIKAAYDSICSLTGNCTNYVFADDMEAVCNEIVLLRDFHSSLNNSNLSTVILPDLCNIPNVSITDIDRKQFDKLVADDVEIESISMSFPQHKEQCCIFDDCIECCDEQCQDSMYPVIMVHGHAFNKDISADYSLENFNELQERLEEIGYLNAGAISLYTVQDEESLDIWSKIPLPLSLKISYYYDLFREPENYVVVQTKSENIDTYAIRLKELIETVKFKTGKEKVNIIAHSMGGLVARRYLQIFDKEDAVNKLILIGTPNEGVVGRIADLCPLIGEHLECRDMKQGSLFLNKLNTGKKPDIPVYMIIGRGCALKEGDSDGIVLVENAELDYATNYYIDGSCKGLKTLHTSMLHPDEYPKVFSIIQSILQDS